VKQIKIVALVLSLMSFSHSVCMNPQIAAGILGLQAAVNLIITAAREHHAMATLELAIAAEKGDLPAVEFWLRRPGQVNAKSGAQQNTALILARLCAPNLKLI
jgi:hypothetical protein